MPTKESPEPKLSWCCVRILLNNTMSTLYLLILIMIGSAFHTKNLGKVKPLFRNILLVLFTGGSPPPPSTPPVPTTAVSSGKSNIYV